MKFLSLFLAVLAALTGSAAGIEFILPASPAPAERSAATELRLMLAARLDTLKIGGRVIEKIHVGNTPEILKKFGQLKDEQWRIVSEGDTLFIFGGGSRGVYYAAAHFLEDQLGIHIWSLFEEHVPDKEAAVELPALDYGGRPVFWSRNVFHETLLPRDRGRFAAFNRLNAMGSHDIAPAYGSRRIIGRPQLCHTFDDYFPAAEYAATHPEYYALIGGKRVPGPGGQLCLSNPEVLEIVWRKLQNYILEDEAEARKKGIEPPAWYDFSYNDNGGVCQCENCQRIIREEGAVSGLLFRVLRELGARLKKFRPGLNLTTIAYWQNEFVPKVRPPENLIVRLCNTSQNQVTPISAPGSAVYRKKVLDWGRVAKLGFWEYGITCYDTYFECKPPYPNEFIMEEQFRFYRDNNAIAAFCELQSPEFSDMHEMKAFLLAKFFEDPGQDGGKLRRTFLNDYYGPAARFIDAYRRTLWESVKAHNSQCFTYNILPAFFTYFDLKTVVECDKLFDEAVRAAADDPVLSRRVRRARLNLDNAILTYYRQLLKEHLASGGKREVFRFDWKTVRDRYRAERIEAMKFYFSHKPGYVDDMIAAMDKRLAVMDRLPMVFPRENVPPQWIEVPANLAGFFRNELVPDPESPIGFAAKVDINKNPGYHDLPMSCGGYDNATTKYIYNVALNGAAGPGYHWYRTPDFVPRHAGLAYILNDWTFQVPMAPAVAANRGSDRRWYCCYSIKFVGPRYAGAGRNGEPGIYIDRAFLVPADMPFTLGGSTVIGGKSKDKTAKNVL